MAEKESVIDRLAGRKWSDIEILEHAGYLLFPGELKSYTKERKFKSTEIRIRVPREPDLRKARVLARQKADSMGLDPKLDPDLFDNLDTMCILVEAIRNTTKPFEPLVVEVEELEKRFDKQSLTDVYAQVDALKDVIDPRPTEINKEEFLAIIAAVAKERNIAPLAVLDGRAQNNLIVTMAEALQSFLESKSSQAQSEPSTPAH